MQWRCLGSWFGEGVVFCEGLGVVAKMGKDGGGGRGGQGGGRGERGRGGEWEKVGSSGNGEVVGCELWGISKSGGSG